MWPALEKIYKTGKARSIGVSNWTVKKLERLLAIAEVKPVVNQFEIHPFFPNTKLVEYCLEHDILPVCTIPSPNLSNFPLEGTFLRLFWLCLLPFVAGGYLWK
jgi:aryl-alcohol dehydrogenase-like predicted oxidoreductase